MQISLTTPALLFPAISLLLLAYTNRFLALASLIRNLHARYMGEKDIKIKAQISNLRKRVILIRNMQLLGISSLFLCGEHVYYLSRVSNGREYYFWIFPYFVDDIFVTIHN